MPIIKSAKKKLRQDIKRKKENQKIKNLLKGSIKKVEKVKSKKAFQKLQEMADKAVKKNIIHKNRASRIKARIAKRLIS